MFAPIVLFAVRGAMMTWSARSLVWPSFDFRGAGHLARYGGVMAAGQLFWFLQSQATCSSPGGCFSAHKLGIYTTSLFLTQIFVSKFVPPLNEVAFSRLCPHPARSRRGRRAHSCERSRSSWSPPCPSISVWPSTAEPLVLTVLGPKWQEAAPVVQLLALAMPFMTLQVLYTPACDARGRPGDRRAATARSARCMLAVGFLVGVQWGPVGIATAWIVAYPIYLAISSLAGAAGDRGERPRRSPWRSRRRWSPRRRWRWSVTLVDRALPPLPPLPRLAMLVAVGAAVYAGWLVLFARATLRELIATVKRAVSARRITPSGYSRASPRHPPRSGRSGI